MSWREYDALVHVWRQSNERSAWLVAALRADVYNTAGKSFDRHFTADEFMGTRVDGVEERAAKLREQGYSPAEAAAIANSKQSTSDKVRVIDQVMRSVKERKKNPARMMPPPRRRNG